MSKPTVWRWQERYLDEGVPGLKRDKTRPSHVPPLPREIRLKVIAKTVQETTRNADLGEGSLRSIRRMLMTNVDERLAVGSGHMEAGVLAEPIAAYAAHLSGLGYTALTIKGYIRASKSYSITG